MNKTSIIRGILALAAAVVVAGCASKSGSSAGSEAAAAAARDSGGNAYSSGAGERAQFSGTDAEWENKSYSTIAPRRQVYYFPFDNSQVNDEYLDSIKAQAKYLANNPRARILLAGHTDERGSREYNIGLGERRANSVRDVLRLEGAPHQQIRVVSYGQERPAVTGYDESAYQYNRRVELIYEAK